MPTDTPGEVVHLRRSDYDVRIDRATVWGNPFSHGVGTRAKYKVDTREDAIEAFRQWALESEEFGAVWIRAHVHELAGKRLGCWCAPLPCHGDVLLAMAHSSQLHDEGQDT